jgi:hypothetical protein
MLEGPKSEKHDVIGASIATSEIQEATPKAAK